MEMDVLLKMAYFKRDYFSLSVMSDAAADFITRNKNAAPNVSVTQLQYAPRANEYNLLFRFVFVLFFSSSLDQTSY